MDVNIFTEIDENATVVDPEKWARVIAMVEEDKDLRDRLKKAGLLIEKEDLEAMRDQINAPDSNIEVKFAKKSLSRGRLYGYR